MASLWRVDVTRPESDGRFLGGHVDLCQQLEQRRFRAVNAEHCYDVTKSYGVHVVCIAKTHPAKEDGEDAGSEALGMDWTPGDTTQLRLHDCLYVLGSREDVSRFAEAVGVMKELNEELEWSTIGVPEHWVGWRLGRQTDDRPNGLNLRVLCGATLLGLRNPNGTVDLVPDANTELLEGQEMLFLHSLKSHPGAAFEFVFDPQLLDPECWRRLSNAVNSVLRGAVCGVCLETLQAAECRKFPCGHMFHTECVRDYIKERNCCPMCREKVWEWQRKDGKWIVKDRTMEHTV